MRRLIAIILASTFLSSEPVFFNSEPAQARSLFEALFPRAAEARRKRRERAKRRERELRLREHYATFGTTRIKAPSFKKYVPTSLVAVNFGLMAKSFAEHEQKLLAGSEAAKDETAIPVTKTADTTGSVEVDATGEVVVDPSSGNLASTPTMDGTATGGSVATYAAPISIGGSTPNDGEANGEGQTAENESLPSIEEVAAATEIQPTLVSQPVEDEVLDEVASPVRLSAGAVHLESIAVRARKDLGNAMVAHYKANPSFVWIDEAGQISEKGNAALHVLADAESYGLRIEDYALPLMTVGDDASEDDLLRASMEFEFALTAATLRYMADARNGYVDPNKISGYHDFGELGTDYAALLSDIDKTEDISQLMLDQHPHDEVFEKLRKELAELRQSAEGYDSITIADGTFVRPGQTSDQMENIVESIRRKASSELLADHFDVFSVSHEEGAYSEEVVAMIRDFQSENGLKRDGIIGKNTISKMSSDDPAVQLNKVLYAMERLRWHPDRLGSTHVFINQPAYRASYVSNGRSTLSMRAVVGKPANQTSFFYDKIEYVEYNPYWGVPRSILVNEMLPKLMNNPYYLDDKGYEITNVRGRHISSGSVDWWSVGKNFPYNVRQPPGPRNALGEL